MYDPAAVANYLLDLAERDHVTTTQLKLQKILYFCHGWTLANYDQPLVTETFAAWQYGPALPSLWRVFRRHGKDDLRPYRVKVHTKDGLTTPRVTEPRITAMLDAVWNLYRFFDAGHLVEITHAEGTPWHQTWFGIGPDQPITDERIKQYFLSVKEMASK